MLNTHLDKRNLGNWSWEIFHGSKEPLLCVKVDAIVEGFFLIWGPGGKGELFPFFQLNKSFIQKVTYLQKIELNR